MMLTTTGQATDAERCRQLGISAYLTKPVKPSDLFDVIVTALGTSALESESPHGRITIASAATSEEAPTANRFMILLAEDNAVNQRVAVRLLQKKVTPSPSPRTDARRCNAWNKNALTWC